MLFGRIIMLALMDRPIPPEAAERPRIKRAMRAARFMKWGAPLVALAGMLVAVIIGANTAWYLGLIALIIAWSTLYIFGYTSARCPRCGQVWWSGYGVLGVQWWYNAKSAAKADETESFVCRRCRLDIGFGLRGI